MNPAEIEHWYIALKNLMGAAKNEMVLKGLPLEWSPDSAMGKAEALIAAHERNLAWSKCTRMIGSKKLIDIPGIGYEYEP